MSTSNSLRDLQRPQVYQGALIPLGFQQLTGMSSAQSLTVPVGATLAIIQAEAQSVRWRDDGTAPTASVGMLILTATSGLAYVGNLANIQLIQATSGAIANVSYYQ